MESNLEAEIAFAIGQLDQLSIKSSESGLSEETCWEIFGGPCPEALKKKNKYLVEPQKEINILLEEEPDNIEENDEKHPDDIVETIEEHFDDFEENIEKHPDNIVENNEKDSHDIEENNEKYPDNSEENNQKYPENTEETIEKYPDNLEENNKKYPDNNQKLPDNIENNEKDVSLAQIDELLKEEKINKETESVIKQTSNNLEEHKSDINILEKNGNNQAVPNDIVKDKISHIKSSIIKDAPKNQEDFKSVHEIAASKARHKFSKAQYAKSSDLERLINSTDKKIERISSEKVIKIVNYETESNTTNSKERFSTIEAQKDLSTSKASQTTSSGTKQQIAKEPTILETISKNGSKKDIGTMTSVVNKDNKSQQTSEIVIKLSQATASSSTIFSTSTTDSFEARKQCCCRCCIDQKIYQSYGRKTKNINEKLKEDLEKGDFKNSFKISTNNKNKQVSCKCTEKLQASTINVFPEMGHPCYKVNNNKLLNYYSNKNKAVAEENYKIISLSKNKANNRQQSSESDSSCDCSCTQQNNQSLAGALKMALEKRNTKVQKVVRKFEERQVDLNGCYSQNKNPIRTKKICKCCCQARHEERIPITKYKRKLF